MSATCILDSTINISSIDGLIKCFTMTQMLDISGLFSNSGDPYYSALNYTFSINNISYTWGINNKYVVRAQIWMWITAFWSSLWLLMLTVYYSNTIWYDLQWPDTVFANIYKPTKADLGKSS